jgi:putative heme-binding domain-containing protein
VYPSLVVSDQYRSVTVQTVDGLVHTGMPAQQPDNSKVVLLLPDATRIEIPKKNIDQMAPATTSVMPEGVLKDLSLAEIADLFAYLETTKSGGEAVAAAP